MPKVQKATRPMLIPFLTCDATSVRHYAPRRAPCQTRGRGDEASEEPGGGAMMGTKLRAFAPLCNRSLEHLVPADNFDRHLEDKLDLGFVRDLVRSIYKEHGRPSIDPAVFFKTH